MCYYYYCYLHTMCTNHLPKYGVLHCIDPISDKPFDTSSLSLSIHSQHTIMHDTGSALVVMNTRPIAWARGSENKTTSPASFAICRDPLKEGVSFDRVTYRYVPHTGCCSRGGCNKGGVFFVLTLSLVLAYW